MRIEFDVANGERNFKTETLSTRQYPSGVDPRVKVPPCLVLVVGPSSYVGRQWVLDKPAYTLGRLSASDIHVEDGSLSKAHLRIMIENDSVTVTDLGSTNKTKVNGQTLTPNQPRSIKNNDQIAAGALIFKFLQKGLVSETEEKIRMQKELETAKGIQAIQLPSLQEARYGNVQIGGRYRAASECGGDWWWHWAAGNRVFALIGDATGHGASAALITSAARSAIAIMESDPSVAIDKVYLTLSNALRKCGGSKILMSAFILEIDTQLNNINFINASHWPALHFTNPTGEPEHIRGEVSAPLGGDDLEFSVGTLKLIPGSRIVLYTDGLTERTNASGIQISERQTRKFFKDAHAMAPQNQSQFLDLILQASDKAAENHPQDDDITIVALDLS